MLATAMLDRRRDRTRSLRALIKDRRGATMMEYSLIVALLSFAAIVGYSALGDSVENMYDTVAEDYLGSQE